MDASVVWCLQTNPSSRVPLAVGVFRGVAMVATATNHGQDISVQCIQDGQQTDHAKDIILRGHYEPISLLSFSKSPLATHTTLLCSSSPDATLLWDLEKCFSHTQSCQIASSDLLSSRCVILRRFCSTSGAVSSSKSLVCVSSAGGVVSHVTYSDDLLYVALCKGQEVIVYNSQTCEVDTTLVGHTAAVTCSVFSPHHKHRTIITASEDRTFKVWDIENISLVYQSSIVSASPFLCVDVSPRRQVLVTGTADGILRVYDLSEGGGYNCLLRSDVTKELERLEPKDTASSTVLLGAEGVSATINSMASWQDGSRHVSETTPTSSVDIGPAILAVRYCTPPPSDCDDTHRSGYDDIIGTSQHISEVLRAPPSLLVVTHTNLIQYSANTLELLNTLDFREPHFFAAAECVPSVTAAADLTPDTQNNNVYYCELGAMFSTSATVVKVDVSQHKQTQQHINIDGIHSESCEGDTVISVLSSVPLVLNSPLKAELSLKEPKAKKLVQNGKSSGARRQGRHVSGVVDRPLTFKSKVKSSGYTDTPRTKPFAPKTNTSKLPSKKKGASSLTSDSKPQLRKREYPSDGDPPTHPLHTMQLTDRPTAVNSCCFSGSGQYMTCACADKNAYAVRMPLSLERTHAFVGHNESVLSACWSHSGEWMMSSSKDRTVRLWSTSLKDPLLCIDKMTHNFRTTDTSESQSEPNKPFSKDITTAQFYYLDKFIILTSGNTLYMYKYHIDTTRPDDIKRYQSNTRYKLVTSLNMGTAQTITAMSSINDFYSYIVLVGGSNKSVDVFDMNVCKKIRTNNDCHSRPLHCMQQNKGSKFISHPPSAYDLYLTAAVTDGIKLWDLRTNRCVSRFTSHHNQAQSVTAVFSPCGRFIATGSEDKCAYIYDIRSSSPLHKLKGHSDVVGSLAYHPLAPMLVTATLNGTLKFFNNNTLM